MPGDLPSRLKKFTGARIDDLKHTSDDYPTPGIILCADKDETIVRHSALSENQRLFGRCGNDALGGIVLVLRKHYSHHSSTMPALVIKSFPEALHAKLRQIAAAHRRSLTQETIHIIEKAIAEEGNPTKAVSEPPPASYWANRKLLPEWEAALKAGAFSGGTDSTQIISEERDAR